MNKSNNVLGRKVVFGGQVCETKTEDKSPFKISH